MADGHAVPLVGGGCGRAIRSLGGLRVAQASVPASTAERQARWASLGLAWLRRSSGFALEFPKLAQAFAHRVGDTQNAAANRASTASRPLNAFATRELALQSLTRSSPRGHPIGRAVRSPTAR